MPTLQSVCMQSCQRGLMHPKTQLWNCVLTVILAYLRLLKTTVPPCKRLVYVLACHNHDGKCVGDVMQGTVRGGEGPFSLMRQSFQQA